MIMNERSFNICKDFNLLYLCVCVCVCVIKFYYSIRELEKASDIGIRRGQKEYPLASVNNEVI